MITTITPGKCPSPCPGFSQPRYWAGRAKCYFALSACIVPCLVWLAAMGCTRTSGMPTPLAAEQIPAEVQKVFTKAAPQIKEAAERMIASMQKKEYPAAYQAAQFL